VDGCTKLEHFDVSQCRNLQGWLDGGGEERVNEQIKLGLAVGSGGRRRVRFETVADGRWRAGSK
jgi:F-box/leucine-rich repeat protein 7